MVSPVSFLDEPQCKLGEKAPIELIVVVHTLLYRHLATTRVFSGDRAVEIGCSYGHCTALFNCPTRLGIDHAPEKVEQAARDYPGCRFACGDVLNDNNLEEWLDLKATVLFLDIGGGRDFKPVMKSLAICMPRMPHLRLVVTKSTEVHGFLSRFDDAVETVAHDLKRVKDDDSHVAEELANEVRRRGGEIPLSQIGSLRCGPRLRYLVGKSRMLAFLRRQSPLLQLFESETGDDDTRVRAAPGPATPAPIYAQRAVRDELCRKLKESQLRDGEDWSFFAVFGRLPRGLFRKYMAVAAEPELFRQASDPGLDHRGLVPWTEDWLNVVAMRHFHFFLEQTDQFVLSGEQAGEVPTVEELRAIKVRWTGNAGDADERLRGGIAAESGEAAAECQQERVVLQLMDANWSSGPAGEPKVDSLYTERAWLLAGETVRATLWPLLKDGGAGAVTAGET